MIRTVGHGLWKLTYGLKLEELLLRFLAAEVNARIKDYSKSSPLRTDSRSSS